MGGVSFTPLKKIEQTECFETSAYKIQTPENRPKERIKRILSPMLSVTTSICFLA